jgi:hypothetical protein|tara:strand:- start:679 stop:1308 length:630 start_codon:yes stop_codon:yes gene_type:complete
MAAPQDKIRVMTEEGRLIVHSLFEKDAYTNEQGKDAEPKYKVELAFANDAPFLDKLEDMVVAAAVAEWGKPAEKDYDGGGIRSPLRDGNAMADEREKKGKSGDAYRGMTVIRAATQFNSHGDNAPGGVFVAGADGEELPLTDRGTIYGGSYGRAQLVVQAYKVQERGVTFYLEGYQFLRDGERLGMDRSGMFKPMMGEGSETKGRRQRG